MQTEIKQGISKGTDWNFGFGTDYGNSENKENNFNNRENSYQSGGFNENIQSQILQHSSKYKDWSTEFDKNYSSKEFGNLRFETIDSNSHENIKKEVKPKSSIYNIENSFVNYGNTGNTNTQENIQQSGGKNTNIQSEIKQGSSKVADWNFGSETGSVNSEKRENSHQSTFNENIQSKISQESLKYKDWSSEYGKKFGNLSFETINSNSHESINNEGIKNSKVQYNMQTQSKNSKKSDWTSPKNYSFGNSLNSYGSNLNSQENIQQSGKNTLQLNNQLSGTEKSTKSHLVEFQNILNKFKNNKNAQSYIKQNGKGKNLNSQSKILQKGEQNVNGQLDIKQEYLKNFLVDNGSKSSKTSDKLILELETGFSTTDWPLEYEKTLKNYENINGRKEKSKVNSKTYWIERNSNSKGHNIKNEQSGEYNSNSQSKIQQSGMNNNNLQSDISQKISNTNSFKYVSEKNIKSKKKKQKLTDWASEFEESFKNLQKLSNNNADNPQNIHSSKSSNKNVQSGIQQSDGLTDLFSDNTQEQDDEIASVDDFKLN